MGILFYVTIIVIVIVYILIVNKIKNKSERLTFKLSFAIVLCAVCIFFLISIIIWEKNDITKERMILTKISPDDKYKISLNEYGGTFIHDSSEIRVYLSEKEKNNWIKSSCYIFKLKDEQLAHKEDFKFEWYDDCVKIIVLNDKKQQLICYRVYWQDVFGDN